MRKRVENVVLAGLVAGVVVACSGPAMEMAGEAMQDVGTMLGDAGVAMMSDAGDAAGGGSGAGGGDGMMRDAGQLLVDAGNALADAGAAISDDSGQMLRDAGDSMVDAGQALKDAGHDAGDAALAQACGQWCTAEGATRIITADLDSTRYFRTRFAASDWKITYDKTLSLPPPSPSTTSYLRSIQLAQGPLVYQGGGAGNLFLVARGTSCDVTYDDSSLPYKLVFAGEIWQPVEVGMMIRGDETLCSYVANGVSEGDSLPPPPALTLRGFRPYE